MGHIVTVLDLGDIGQHEAVVSYKDTPCGIHIVSVLGLGMDFAPYLTSDAKESIIDLCRADCDVEAIAECASWEQRHKEAAQC